jgi:hypothetical protein
MLLDGIEKSVCFYNLFNIVEVQELSLYRESFFSRGAGFALFP